MPAASSCIAWGGGASSVRRKREVDWSEFLRRIASGQMVAVVRSQPGMPPQKQLSARRKSDTSFAASYLDAIRAGAAARGKKLCWTVPRGWPASFGELRPAPQVKRRDWEGFLREIAGGTPVRKIRGGGRYPQFQEWRERADIDPDFAERFLAACRAGNETRVAQGKVSRRLNKQRLKRPRRAPAPAAWTLFLERVAAGGRVMALHKQRGMPSQRDNLERLQYDPLYAADYRAAICASWRPGAHGVKMHREAKVSRSVRASLSTFDATSLVPRHLPSHQRSEVQQDLIVGILEGEFTVEQAPAMVSTLVKRMREREANKWGDLSLDGLADAGFDPTAGAMPFARSKKRLASSESV